jgi:predicted RecA/RadA family phage recombinase
MKNFRHKGDTCTFSAPYAVASGGGFLVGAIFAIANFDAAQGAPVEGDCVGVFTLPKSTAAGTDFAAGTKLYWDNAAKVVTKTAAGNTLIGVALADAAVADATCVVRLNGTVS